MLITDQYLFFYSTTEIYSNWYPTRFKYEGISFANSEQAMMWGKAKLMGDEDSMAKIRKTPDPYNVKRLGRQIKNWKEQLWINKRLDLVAQVLYAKFSTNEALRNELLSTGNLHLVEAASNDKIWGIGMDEDDPKIHSKKNWQGLNLLGEALMIVRERIRRELDK